MELKNSEEEKEYRYFDPKLLRPGDTSGTTPRTRTPFQVMKAPRLCLLFHLYLNCYSQLITCLSACAMLSFPYMQIFHPPVTFQEAIDGEKLLIKWLVFVIVIQLFNCSSKICVCLPVQSSIVYLHWALFPQWQCRKLLVRKTGWISRFCESLFKFSNNTAKFLLICLSCLLTLDCHTSVTC